LYLWLFLGETFSLAFAQRKMAVAFVGLIILPLVAAFITQRWAGRKPGRSVLLQSLAWFPVPLLAWVVLVIAATQVNLVAGSLGILVYLLSIFIGFLLVAAGIARVMASAFALPPAKGRVLAFSFGSRNSFVVLPIALALPASLELAVVVVVFQSLVELVGMIVYLWWIPAILFPRRLEKEVLK
jgi:ACR3 family arsenite efflux pump ArsB